MNVEKFKHPHDCDVRMATLKSMIARHKKNDKDGIGTFKAELAALRARRRELRRQMQIGLPFAQLDSLHP